MGAPVTTPHWRKLGRVFCPDGDRPWMHSHAALPVASPLAGDDVRIFFSARDAQKRSHMAFVDIALGEQPRVLRIAEQPVLAPGPPGAFDDAGVSLSCITPAPNESRAYYFGWNLGLTAPWRNSIGVAVGDPAAPSFTRPGPGPLLDRSSLDPYSLSYPHVHHRADGGWRMWYLSLTAFTDKPADMRAVIRHATSADGFTWRVDEQVCLDHGPDDTVLCRPWVMHDGDLYRMWFCHRGEAYRIGYAESADGLSWTRRDDLAGIAVSASGWDSAMICYPSVFDHGGRRYMLYNGDGYGETGFGLAVLEAT
jgi:hypothetical protein